MPSRERRLSQTPTVTERPWTLTGLASAIVAGGVWGALLARVFAELAPLWFAQAGLWTYLFPLFSAVAVPAAHLQLSGRLDARSVAHRSWPLALGAIYLFQPRVAPLWGIAALLAGPAGTLWLTQTRQAAPPGLEWPWDGAIFFSSFALYLSTLAPSVLPGDSGEFQLVAPTLGIPHPTGYPLYLLLGKLFSLFPVSSVAYRINLLSAVAAAGAVWASYRAARAMGVRRAAALTAAAMLAVSDTFWSQATIAEKYALNALFVALTLWLGLRWRAAHLAGRHGGRWLALWALCYGLSLAHHRTMLLLAPVFLALVAFTDRRLLRPRFAWRPLLIALLPLALYGLLPLLSALDPPYAYARIDSPRAFLDLVLARTYQSGLFRGGWSALLTRAAELGRLLARQFSPVGLALALAGLGMLIWRQRRVGWVVLAGIAVQVVFALNYEVPNTPVYYLPAYVWLAVCASVSIDQVFSLVARGTGSLVHDSAPEEGDKGGQAHAHLTLAWSLLVAALPVALCASRWSGMDGRRTYASLAFDHTYGQVALRSVEPDALVIGDWMPATVLWYTQYVEGLASGAQVVSVDSLEWQWENLAREALAQGRPVYLARPLIAASEGYALSSAGPIVRLLPEASTLPPPMDVSLDVELGGELELLGCDWLVVGAGAEGEVYVPPDRHLEGGSTLYVTLHWRAIDVPTGDYAVTVSLVDAAGQPRLERQSRHPVSGTYPTSRWQPGEVVADAYVLDLPPYLPSGEYRLLAKIGVPFAERGLADPSGVDEVFLGTVDVHKPQRWPRASLSVPLRRRAGNLILMGIDAPEQAALGERERIALQWLVAGRQNGGIPRLAMVFGTGDNATVPSLLDIAEEDWQDEALIVQEYVFTMPEDLDVKRLQIRVPLRDGRVWTYDLPTRLTESAPPVADFGGQIYLRSYTYDARSLRPGDTVHLTLDWEAATNIPEAYKVFVHVLGPAGLPIAQQDNEPVNGTYPTTRWQRGDRISDPYAFSLPQGLPPGEYPVEVGLYRLSDLSRLPLLDQEQSVIDDKVYLDPVVIE